MGKKQNLLLKILNNSKNVSFNDMQTLVEAFGFTLLRINGSHHIFAHPDIDGLVNIQNKKRWRINLMKDYHINIFYSEDDEGYIADIPDLRYCSAFGDTPLEALQELDLAKQAWLETAKAEGKNIPEPTYRPVIYQLQSA